MESANLNPSDLEPDPDLDLWLRRNARLMSLADDGFTTRVLSAMPAPLPAIAPARVIAAVRDRQNEARRRAWFCAGGVAIGLVVAFADVGGVFRATSAAVETARFSLSGSISEADPMALALSTLAALATAGSLLLVYWKKLPGRRFLT